MLVNLSSHNRGGRSAPRDYVSAESKAIFPGGQADVTDNEINRWGGSRKKGLGSPLINGLTAWLAARSAFLRLLTLRLDLFQEVTHVAKCSLA